MSIFLVRQIDGAAIELSPRRLGARTSLSPPTLSLIIGHDTFINFLANCVSPIDHPLCPYLPS
jgi:hypothetical protein